MIRDCLTDLIGIRGECSPVTPSSGLYVDDLINIDVNKAEKIMDKDDNGFEWMKKRIEEAGIEVTNEVETHFNAHFRREAILEGQTIGFFRDNLKSVAAEATKYKGIRVELDYYDTFSFFLKSVTLQVATSGSVEVKVYNLLSGKELDSFTVTTVADVPTTKIVNKNYTTENQKLHIAVVYNQTMNAYSTTVNEKGCVSCGNRRSNCYRNKYIEAYGTEVLSADAKIKENFKSIGNTGGLSIDYGLSCDIEPFVCNNLNLLANAIRHKAAAEIIRHAKFSTRINSFILVYNEQHEELMNHYEDQYVGYLFGRFNDRGKQLKKGIVDKLALPNSICWKCDKRIANLVRLPG